MNVFSDLIQLKMTYYFFSKIKLEKKSKISNVEQLARPAGLEPTLIPLRYYALEERSDMGVLIALI